MNLSHVQQFVMIACLAGGRALIDATEQRVSRPLPTQGTILAKNAFSLETQVVADDIDHLTT